MKKAKRIRKESLEEFYARRERERVALHNKIKPVERVQMIDNAQRAFDRLIATLPSIMERRQFELIDKIRDSLKKVAPWPKIDETDEEV